LSIIDTGRAHINNTTYIAEIVRSGINSVYKGKLEAALSIGLDTKDTLLFVIAAFRWPAAAYRHRPGFSYAA
jgi:ABC-type amino acid transport system permease subunit